MTSTPIRARANILRVVHYTQKEQDFLDKIRGMIESCNNQLLEALDDPDAPETDVGHKIAAFDSLSHAYFKFKGALDLKISEKALASAKK